MSLKFRAWDGVKFTTSVRMDFHTGNLFDSGEYKDYFRDYPVVQYTGIRDRNGNGDNELWQNDLVKCSGHGIGRVDRNTWGEWCIYFPDEIPIQDLIMEQDLLELVGNIYENPENWTMNPIDCNPNVLFDSVEGYEIAQKALRGDK